MVKEYVDRSYRAPSKPSLQTKFSEFLSRRNTKIAAASAVFAFHAFVTYLYLFTDRPAPEINGPRLHGSKLQTLQAPVIPGAVPPSDADD